jgi:hypothetical protein
MTRCCSAAVEEMKWSHQWSGRTQTCHSHMMVKHTQHATTQSLIMMEKQQQHQRQRQRQQRTLLLRELPATIAHREFVMNAVPVLLGSKDESPVQWQQQAPTRMRTNTSLILRPLQRLRRPDVHSHQFHADHGFTAPTHTPRGTATLNGSLGFVIVMDRSWSRNWPQTYVIAATSRLLTRTAATQHSATHHSTHTAIFKHLRHPNSDTVCKMAITLNPKPHLLVAPSGTSTHAMLLMARALLRVAPAGLLFPSA